MDRKIIVGQEQPARGDEACLSVLVLWRAILFWGHVDTRPLYGKNTDSTK
jgi:hypothetical protein